MRRLNLMNKPRITTANEDNSRYATMVVTLEELTAAVSGRVCEDSAEQIDNMKKLFGCLVAISNDYWIYFNEEFKTKIEQQRKNIRDLLHYKLCFKDGDGV